MIENFIYIWLGISIRKSGGWEMEGVTCTRRWLIWSLSLSQSMLLSSLELSSLPFMFSLHILCQVLQFLVPLSLLENVPSKLIASTPLLVILYVFEIFIVSVPTYTILVVDIRLLTFDWVDLDVFGNEMYRLRTLWYLSSFPLGFMWMK